MVSFECMFEWIEELNPEQSEAVMAEDRHLLVVAGAGTGKTRTLACRVARLLADGVRPERILLLTFSRRAAREMTLRAGQLAEFGGAPRVWGGTFHAIAHRLLRQHGEAVGLRTGFTVLDQSDATDLLGLVRHDLGLGEQGRRFAKKDTLASIYSRTVNAQRPLIEVVDESYPWCRRDVGAIGTVFNGYLERKRLGNVVDFDDLLLYWRALAQSPRLGLLLQTTFEHILVDEFQDTNALQADIVAAMAGPNVSVAAVGDDAQAIYGFRSGSARHMSEFPQRFPGARIVRLVRNYRSTPDILDVANNVMAAATAPGDLDTKYLRAERPPGVRPQLAACVDELAQSSFVCDLVLENREQGIALREQAVLFRTGHHSDGLELELARRNIPFVKFGGLRFLEAAHIKDVLALLRLLDNPTDELAWRRILALMNGVGPATIRRLLEELEVGTPQALTRLLGPECPRFPPSALADLSGVSAALGDCVADDLPPADQIERLALACVPLFNRRYPATAKVRLADIEHLRIMATDYRSRSRFLAEMTLDPPSATSDLAGAPHLDDDYLVLSTIHSAKGGEWRCVHIIHAADGNIPSDMALGSPEELEEERRLMYVGVTRARDNLAISYPIRFYVARSGSASNAWGDAHTYGQPSRFLDATTAVLDSISVGEVTVERDPVAPELAALWS